MTERKVDVMDKTGKVLHTYPITIGTIESPRRKMPTTRRRHSAPRGPRSWFPSQTLPA